MRALPIALLVTAILAPTAVAQFPPDPSTLEHKCVAVDPFTIPPGVEVYDCNRFTLITAQGTYQPLP